MYPIMGLLFLKYPAMDRFGSNQFVSITFPVFLTKGHRV